MVTGSCEACSSLRSLPSDDSRSIQPPCCSFISYWRLQSGFNYLFYVFASVDIISSNLKIYFSYMGWDTKGVLRGRSRDRSLLLTNPAPSNNLTTNKLPIKKIASIPKNCQVPDLISVH